QPDHGFGQRVVVAVAHAAHRWLDASLDQAVRVADRQVLAAAVGMVDQRLLRRPASPHRLLERVEHELRLLRRTGPPADDPPGEHVITKATYTKPCHAGT